MFRATKDAFSEVFVIWDPILTPTYPNPRLTVPKTMVIFGSDAKNFGFQVQLSDCYAAF